MFAVPSEPRSSMFATLYLWDDPRLMNSTLRQLARSVRFHVNPRSFGPYHPLLSTFTVYTVIGCDISVRAPFIARSHRCDSSFTVSVLQHFFLSAPRFWSRYPVHHPWNSTNLVYQPWTIASISVEIGCDALITGFMIYHLRKSRTQFERFLSWSHPCNPCSLTHCSSERTGPSIY